MVFVPSIAVVEGDGIQRQLLATYLGLQGFQVTSFERGAELRTLPARDLPDLVLLDVPTPGEEGISLARHVRERGPQVGIIMVSGASETVSRVRGLESGADDYIVKPFDPRELLARVRSVLRRLRRGGEAVLPSRVRMGRCVLDLDRRTLLDTATAAEDLSDDAFELLRAFATNPHRPLEPDWLAEVACIDRPQLAARLAQIRQLVERDPEHPQAIRWVAGVGYMFVPGAQ